MSVYLSHLHAASVFAMSTCKQGVLVQLELCAIRDQGQRFDSKREQTIRKGLKTSYQCFLIISGLWESECVH